jgi:5'-3' exonuclease
MSIYSFLIAVRSDGQQLMNETGETTSHLMGMFYRTLRIVDNGIKPLYVFDGAPPKLKSGELAKRVARKAEAHEAHEEAKETGTAEDVEKFSRRTVRVTREHNAECKKLLKLMGVPYIDAPTEAEAQCAVLARAGKVYAAASEDMDTLCFESPILLRHLTFSEQRKEPIQEIHLDRALEGLHMDRKQVSACSRGPAMESSLLCNSVHRPLYSSRLRLCRARPESRAQHGLETHSRARFPREGGGSHRERSQEKIHHSRRLAIQRGTRAVFPTRRPRCE